MHVASATSSDHLVRAEVSHQLTNKSGLGCQANALSLTTVLTRYGQANALTALRPQYEEVWIVEGTG